MLIYLIFFFCESVMHLKATKKIHHGHFHYIARENLSDQTVKNNNGYRSFVYSSRISNLLIRPIDGVIKMEFINISDVGGENIFPRRGS